eukprot:TRINITY_DN7473_c1_g2_i3.p1 TRINITY_DN7473_c1_g2~~TRINITY_DN7473_c1_g2_i3.p1  ORF type:complete len:207 (-),score=33.25 TRINITY_DN7473_c1_g2_i3:631-1251(-)
MYLRGAIQLAQAVLMLMLLHLSFSLAEAGSLDALSIQALSSDDECKDKATCSLSALQLKGEDIAGGKQMAKTMKEQQQKQEVVENATAGTEQNAEDGLIERSQQVSSKSVKDANSETILDESAKLDTAVVRKVLRDDPFCRNGGAYAGDGQYCHRGKIVSCKGRGAPKVVNDCQTIGLDALGESSLLFCHCHGGHNEARCGKDCWG